MRLRWLLVVILVFGLAQASRAEGVNLQPQLELSPYVHGNLLALSYFGPDRVVPGPVTLFGLRAGALLKQRITVGGELAYAPLLFGTRYQDAVHLLMVGPYVAPILKAWTLWKLRLLASGNLGLAIQTFGPQRQALLSGGFVLAVLLEYVIWSRVALGFELGMRNQFIRGEAGRDGIGSFYFGVNVAMPEPHKPMQQNPPDETPKRPGTTTRDPAPKPPGEQPGTAPPPTPPPTVDDPAKQEDPCGLRVELHRPISQDDSEPVVADKLAHGAYTLRNDDADYTVGDRRTTLPIGALPTDLEINDNEHENDLVRLDAVNPGLTDVYLFAFKLKAEADLEVDTAMGSPNGAQVGSELLAYTNARKTAREGGFPMAIPVGTKTIWIEGARGGRYRFVLAQVGPKVDRAVVRYQREPEETNPKFECRDRAALTVVVVDIYQTPGDRQRDKKRIRKTAFDVYWGGKPYFEAQVWPGGGTYTWATPYKKGTTVQTVPATAVTGPVAGMDPDRDEGETRTEYGHNPKRVNATAAVRGGENAKERIDGGVEIIHPAPGGVPSDYDRDPADRFPRRISVQYVVENETLVRAEPLAILLPRVVSTPNVATIWPGSRGDHLVVSSTVQYSIRDSYDRVIRAPDRDAYLRFYGAGMRAWEALGGDAAHGVREVDPHRDVLRLGGLPAGIPGFEFGTAQRSQARLEDDRMTAGTFEDTLRLTLAYGVNARQRVWQHYTGNTTNQQLQAARDAALLRGQQYTQLKEKAKNDAAKERERVAFLQREDANLTRYPIFSLPQDVILQLRVADVRYDVRVLTQNRLEVFAPYYSSSFSPGTDAERLTVLHLRWTPGTDTSPLLVLPNHMR